MWKGFAAMEICYVLQTTGCIVSIDVQRLHAWIQIDLFVLPVLSELGTIFQVTDDLYMSLLV